ncbi:assimilatory sulfite reductase (NADPH) flavoprotein subunit [uncultured Thiothrix sp.]|uniref:assimilatory sulfite reductase (NADPH) flavoprotein subunit n=1 Tax=uncultured Thiothrix sp. TaxID=223185 RepID=UPI002617366F|nr:assimilatory sulfite reductase (NADPH) flavoprotein subunit [uncultured Thiothrix sp.]
MTVLSAQQLERITSAVTDLSPVQLAWLGGYLSGLSMGKDNVIPFPQRSTATVTTPTIAPVVSAAAAIKTLVLYGTQTGNGKKIAEQLTNHLKAHGGEVSLSSMKDYRPQQLKQEQRLVIVVSTHGNGEPPDDARAFFNFIQSARAPRLEKLEYTVLALGDSSYDEFCQAGLVLDTRFAELGAKRVLDRVDCDVDFAKTAKAWQEKVLEQFKAATEAANTQFVANPVAISVNEALYSNENPFKAELLNSIVLTDTGSSKDVLHLEFSLEGSGIQYQPGDILAIQVHNDAGLVDEVLKQGKFTGSETVSLDGQSLDLRSALTSKLELSTVTKRQLKQYAQLINQAELLTAVEDKEALKDFLWAADWADVLHTYPSQLEAQALVDLLRPLQDRQYSIASSPNAHPDEVHLLVKRVTYTFNGREHLGTASNGLARLQAGDVSGVYIKENPHFRLPHDPQTKIIMIGAGTGVAPFRSFLFEREAQGLSGNTWLFFGEQRFRTDFLYQTEWQSLLQSGVLERMSVAFSRDQAQKVYVQNRLLEAGAEVYQWLQTGAHLYVCGDMHGMAKDVNQALLAIAIQQGGKTPEQAHDWLELLISEHRYQRDVY